MGSCAKKLNIGSFSGRIKAMKVYFKVAGQIEAGRVLSNRNGVLAIYVNRNGLTYYRREREVLMEIEELEEIVAQCEAIRMVAAQNLMTNWGIKLVSLSLAQVIAGKMSQVFSNWDDRIMVLNYIFCNRRFPFQSTKEMYVGEAMALPECLRKWNVETDAATRRLLVNISLNLVGEGICTTSLAALQ